MHRLKLTWLRDLTKPELFGFAKNQVTPFFLNTTDGESIFAWHVVPLGAYMEHRDDLVAQDTGIVADPTTSKGLQLLMADPEARLIIHCAFLPTPPPARALRSNPAQSMAMLAPSAPADVPATCARSRPRTRPKYTSSPSTTAASAYLRARLRSPV